MRRHVELALISAVLFADFSITSNHSNDMEGLRGSARGPAGREPQEDAPATVRSDGASHARGRSPVDAIAQQAYVKASNTDPDDQFGWSVAVSGDTVVIGAPLEDSNARGVNGDQNDNGLMDSGAAYVFVRDGDGVWSQQAYLKASNPDGHDHFGWSVAIAGDTLVVGAEGEDGNARGVNGDESDNSALWAGAAYVFARDETGAWSQQAYLKASNTDANDFFGHSVSISGHGDTVLVGAEGEASSTTGVNGDESDNGAPGSGAAYVFVRDQNGVWTQQAYLKASNTDQHDRFASSVASSGDTVVIGANGEDSRSRGVNGDQDDDTADESGAAYVFVRDGNGVWSQQAYLKASNTDPFDGFAYSLAVSGDTLVVGAPAEDSRALGINGDQDDNGAASSGCAYVFVRDESGAWSQHAYLKASNTQTNDLFAVSTSVSGDTVVVGAEREDSNATGVDGNQGNNNATDSGAAYVFARSREGQWGQQAYVKASNTGSFDLFGFAVSASGSTAVLGAPGEDSNAAGVDGEQNNEGAPQSGAVYLLAGLGAGCIGDLDTDGDVDLDDMELFYSCMGGPGLPNPGCDSEVFARGDIDDDEDIDLGDFALFQPNFGVLCP
jgi:hypothetical protein